VNIPSYPVKAGDIVGVREGDSLKVIGAILATKEAPGMTWLTVNPDRATGTVVRVPTPEDVKDIPCNTQLIVELYSK
jgi:ribosomal protein S4